MQRQSAGFLIIIQSHNIALKILSDLSCFIDSWTSEKGNFKITYGILEYDPLCDSSNMSLDDCKKIAKTIDDNYTTRFDGFVILHGTDTMAYTASALSYMLKDLTKSVVLTGSQKPMEELLTDATKNFLGALILAGPYSSTINEVGIFFHDQLFRGNRTTKHDASAFDGFSSPNRSCLATIGVDVKGIGSFCDMYKCS